MFRAESGELVLPTRADPTELKRHRDRLIGQAFRFTIPNSQNPPKPHGNLRAFRYL